MKKPTEIKVLQDTFTIHWVPKLDDCKGMTESATASIFIDTSFDERTQRHVLLHEILHVIWYCYTLNPPKKYSKKDPGEADDLEEYIVSVYSPAVLQVMEDNPEVNKYLFGRLNK